MCREIKDSGVEWIGKIPNEWSVSKVKWGFIRKNTKAMIDNPTILSLTAKGVKVRDISNNEGQIAESYYNYNPVEKGDLLLNPMDLVSNAFSSVSEINGVISPAYVNLKAAEKYNVNYYDYYFKLQYWGLSFFAHGKGVSYENRWTLNNETLMNYPIPYPKEEEQNVIANYLNKKTSQIDTIISKQKSLIEKYRAYKQSLITETVTVGLNKNISMKDSGIEWIGEIPNHWEIEKGKHILSLLSRKVIDSDEVITCFRDGEVTLRSNRREDGFTFADKEIGYQGIEPGDLVIHGMDGFAGAIGISDSRGKASPVLNVCDTKENKRYIMYYLRRLAYNNVFLALATGIRVRSCDLRWNKIGSLLYPIPPREEQDLIVNYLDNKLKQIDNLIKVKQNYIEKLESYKKSLIYEYVTGKQEVN